MYFASVVAALMAMVVPSFAAPTIHPDIAPRVPMPASNDVTHTLKERAGPSQCSQYSSIQTGSYTVYANGWGEQYGTGTQCSQINGLTGNSLAWSNSWTWSGGPNNVKAYTNVQTPMTSKPLTQYTSIPTTWAWSYTGTSIVANVAYDTFLGTSATATASYEVMIWLGDYGGASPLSDNGYPPTPIATPTIGNTAFNLIYGHNGNTAVYSFVAQSKAATNYSGDLLAFYKYLETNYSVSSSLYLQSIGAGSEVFTGTNAVLTTTAYTLAVN